MTDLEAPGVELVRSARAGNVDAFAELGADIQLLLLTCHQRTLELIQERFPDSRPLRLRHDGQQDLDYD